MTNWEIIEQGIIENKITEQGIIEQHYTTSCKLHTAGNHYDKLSRIIPTNKITDLPAKIVEGHVVYTNFMEFSKKAEEYFEELDGFIYSIRGCLDSFLWEINIIFNLGLKRISYRDVKNAMKKMHGNKETTKLLEKLENDDWFVYLNDIRNELTHHTLFDIFTFTEDSMMYLPKNPIGGIYIKEEKYKVLTCLKTLREKILEFLEKGYEAMLVDLNLRTIES
jgi:hypothetical protein